MNHFHNTIGAEAEQLEIFNKKAEKQEEVILKFFRQAPNGLSPWKVWSICKSYGYRYPVTSVRRAITNLQKAGKLTKTGKQVKGIYGTVEHVWIIK